MFKLFVLTTILAIAAARPGLLAPSVLSSAVVGSIPTSISESSSSIVHSAALAAPVLRAAPLVAATPLVHSAPVIRAHAAPLISATPALSLHSAPLIQTW